jgi:Tfp pilus assembly protein PilX
MLRTQHLARQDARSDKGSAMLIASIVTILLFSMLGAFMTMTNLNKSATNAYIDGNNTFYAAESGLNRRASQVREKFEGYATPSGTSPLTSTTSLTSAMASCFPVSTTTSVTSNDFECRNYRFRYNNNAATAKDSDGNIVLNDVDNNRNSVNYTAFTFAAEKTICATAGALPPCNPAATVIPADRDYGGLNALEYKYAVYATAGKDSTNSTQPIARTDAKTVLQMEFKSLVIPLFQFAAFYDGDLEMTSTSNMEIGGAVHTNSNLYLQPATDTNATTLSKKITVGDRIFRRVDSALTAGTTGDVRLQLPTAPATFLSFPTYASLGTKPIDLTPATIAGISPASAANSATFKQRVKDSTAGIRPLTVPNAGFLRKRNYYNSAIATTTDEQRKAVGEYWAKADIRLEMVPDRDAVEADGVTPLTAANGAAAITGGNAWKRNEAIIPFNFTSIQSGTTASNCSTTPPAAGVDPDPLYVDSTRNGASTLQCNIFTKGELQSLRQPVMVLTAINQLDTSIDHTDPTVAGSESKTLGRPATLPTPPALSTAANNNNTKTKILRALQVAIASTPSPLALDLLDKKFNDTSATGYGGANAAAFKAEFARLLPAITELTTGAPGDRETLLVAAPSEIAALRSAWFLPAPIQRLTSTQDKTTGRANSNIRSSGFYDGREQRWITMLQTNLKSLTVWNRDGLYVAADNQVAALPTNTRAARYLTMMATPYNATNPAKDAAFNIGAGANFTDGRAFIRAAADTTQVLEPNNLGTASQLANFLRLGLGSANRTEGGLVFHATVSDDLNGDGTSTDVSLVNENGTAIVASPRSIPYQRDIQGNIKYQKKADGTFKRDDAGNQIPYILDYIRNYWSQPGSRPSPNSHFASNSPFGFAFNGGDFLPAATTIATDQSVYIQGDFNNNSQQQTAALPIVDPNPYRLPAAIMADTITNLSNQCISNSSTASPTNALGVLKGQINCGLPQSTRGSIDIPGVAANFYTVTGPTAVNAAYLSNTNQSVGNCRAPITAGNYTCGIAAAQRIHSGGINNYMRMLENWSPDDAAGNPQYRYFNYSGSFVSLGTPLEYSGTYAFGGNYYNIPARNFNFDNNFSNFNGLPPMTPSVVYLQQEVFKRNF